MKHGITRMVLGCNQFIPISEDEFIETVAARDRFFRLLGIEEKFDLLAENLAELETDILDLTMRRMLFHEWSWASFRADVATVNRRLANLLSSCRLYVDQVKHDLGLIYGRDSAVRSQVSEAFSREYDTRLGYCLLEALRNHIQHCALPLGHLSYPSTRDFPGNSRSHIRHTCIPSLSLSQLRESGALNKKILGRLKEDAELLDIRPLVRDYVSGLGLVHTKMREWVKEDALAWKTRIVNVRDRFRAEYGEKDVGLAVVERDERNCGIRHAAIFVDFIEEYERLLRKNQFPQHFATQFVTSEVTNWPEEKSD